MSMMPAVVKDYSDGRTKQAFKDETDINKILAKAQKVGSLSHLAKYEAVYGDFAEFDFQDAQLGIAKANTIFAELPSELRREFGQSPQKFFEFANAPENIGKLAGIFPELARPGTQFPNISPTLERPPDELTATGKVAAEPPVPPAAVEPVEEPSEG